MNRNRVARPSQVKVGQDRRLQSLDSGEKISFAVGQERQRRKETERQPRALLPPPVLLEDSYDGREPE